MAHEELEGMISWINSITGSENEENSIRVSAGDLVDIAMAMTNAKREIEQLRQQVDELTMAREETATAEAKHDQIMFLLKDIRDRF